MRTEQSKYPPNEKNNTSIRRLRMQTNIDKLSKSSIEKILNRPLTDDYYAQVVSEALLNLLETNEYE